MAGRWGGVAPLTAGSRLRLLAVVGYLATVNVGAAYLFYHDKQCAIRHQWRVRESTLQLSALAGGWVGGIAAMQAFRHKTSKTSFQVPYYAATLTNVGLVAFLARTRQGRRLVDQVFHYVGVPAGSTRPKHSASPSSPFSSQSRASSPAADRSRVAYEEPYRKTVRSKRRF